MMTGKEPNSPDGGLFRRIIRMPLRLPDISPEEPAMPLIGPRPWSFVGNEQARGTKIVHPNDFDTITADPDQEVRIGTYALSWCTAVALAAQFPDGSKRAYLQHYDVAHRDEALDALTVNLPHFEEAANATRCVIVAPSRPDIFRRNTEVPDDPAQMKALKSVLTAGLAADVGVQVVFYSPGIRNYAQGEGSMLVELLPGEATRIISDMVLVVPVQQ